MHDLASKLDHAAIFTTAEVDRCAHAWEQRQGNNALAAALAPGKQRFRDRYLAATAAGDKAAVDGLDTFRKDVGTYVRLYDFMSQVVDYGDPALEKLAIYLRLLERLIRPDTFTAPIDLSDVALVRIKQSDKGAADIGLTAGTGLKGITGAGSGARRDPRMVAFQQVIDRLNDLFGDENFSTGQKESFVEALLRTLLEDRTLVVQARANTARQFLESPDLHDAIIAAVAGNQGSHNTMARYFAGEGADVDDLIARIGELVHHHATAEG